MLRVEEKMRRLTKVSLRTALATTVLAPVMAMTFPNALTAQMDCGNVQSCGPGDYHTNLREQPYECFWDGITHEDCTICYLGGVPHEWFFCHPPCADPCEGQEDPEVARALQELFDASEQKDLPAVLALAPAVPGTVIFNEERNAIQVKDCQGAVFAHLPIGEDRGLLFAARLLVASQAVELVAARQQSPGS
jgi:hypothetical protein